MAAGSESDLIRARERAVRASERIVRQHPDLAGWTVDALVRAPGVVAAILGDDDVPLAQPAPPHTGPNGAPGDLDALRLENERVRADNERLRSDVRRLRRKSRSSAVGAAQQAQEFDTTRLRVALQRATAEAKDAISEAESLRRELTAVAESTQKLDSAALMLRDVARRHATNLGHAADGARSDTVRDQTLRPLVDQLDRLLTQVVETLQQRVEIEPGPALDWRVTCLGGGHSIGGSAVLVEAGGTRILVDAGVRPNREGIDLLGPDGLEVAFSAPLNGIVVTHAHNDHAGYVPAVVADQGPIPVLASHATAAMLPAVWREGLELLSVRSGKAQHAGLERDPDDVPYDEHDIEIASQELVPLAYGATYEVGALSIRLFRSGHIVGAAGVEIEGGGRRVVVTGDICPNELHSVPAADLDSVAPEPDLLVLETTMCDHVGASREAGEDALVGVVRDVVESGGLVLIPAMATGRAQEVAMLLSDRASHIDVRIDGSARRVSRVYEDYGPIEGHTIRIFKGRVKAVQDRAAEMAVFRRGVVIATSGTLNGGPSLQWAQMVLPRPNSALLFSGLVDEESAGGALARLISEPAGRRRFSAWQSGRPREVDVKARIERFHLPAHATRPGLLTIVERLRPKATMLVHGHYAAQQRFSQVLLQRRLPSLGRSLTWTA